MDNNENSSNLLGRRSALHFLTAGVAAGGVLALAGCKKEESGSAGKPASAAATGPSCSSPVDDASKQLRTALQYKEKADSADKQCKGCAQYVAGQFGDCGGCKLFTGPVQPTGGCLSFAPIGAAPGAASAATPT